MNFLSHYYFDRGTSDPHRVLGMLLPDLVKNANKKWTLHPEKLRSQLQEPGLLSMLDGWNRHLEVDRYFHSSDFFTSHTASILAAVKPILETSPVRPSFLAHISLELMLDSLLIICHNLNPDELYRKLAEADRNTISRFLEVNLIENTQAFFQFFDEFIRSAYLHSYREAANIMYALNRICMRLWPDPLNETQKLQLTAVLLDYQEELEPVFMEIFDEIDVLINSPVRS